VVADLLWNDREVAMQGLMHDAAEAYLGDVTNPLKQMLPEYKAIEEKFDAAIACAFGIPTPFNSMVRHADLMSLAQERRDMFNSSSYSSLRLPAPPPQLLNPWPPHTAEIQFMARFNHLVFGEKHTDIFIIKTVTPIERW
jgi:hypothetical protein